MLGQGPLSAGPLSSLSETIQSASITGTGGLFATGAATVKRSARITAASGIRLTGAAALAVHHWIIALARQRTPRYENRRIALRDDTGDSSVTNPARLYWPDKDPNEKLVYSLAWGDLLGTDPIASVDWTVPAGLTGGDETLTGYVTAIELSGGTAGTTYGVQCTVTTTAELIYSRTVLLEVATR